MNEFVQLKVISVSMLFFLAGNISCTTPVEKSSGSSDLNYIQSAGLTLPEGFSATVFAESPGPGRHIYVNSNGDVYMALSRPQNGKGAVALRDHDNDGIADSMAYFAEYNGTGIHIHNGYLYYGTDTAIVRYMMKEDKLLPEEEAELVALGFPKDRQHAAKPIAFDDEGMMYVNVGAPSNACQEQMRTPGSPGMDPCPILEYAGGIWKFKDDIPMQDQISDGSRYATGLRNCVAMEWNKKINKLYVVMHERDQLHQFFPEHFSREDGINLPAEPFFMVEEGDDFGWPYCYHDDTREMKILSPEYGGDGEITGRCRDKKDAIMYFPAHYAPNDLIFYTGNRFPERYHNGAFIAFHGSWNRAPAEQKGYLIAFVPFEDGLPSGDWEVFADGFADTENIMSPRDARFRPTGLAVGPDGSLFVADSREGRIWKISYNQ